MDPGLSRGAPGADGELYRTPVRGPCPAHARDHDGSAAGAPRCGTKTNRRGSPPAFRSQCGDREESAGRCGRELQNAALYAFRRHRMRGADRMPECRRSAGGAHCRAGTRSGHSSRARRWAAPHGTGADHRRLSSGCNGRSVGPAAGVGRPPMAGCRPPGYESGRGHPHRWRSDRVCGGCHCCVRAVRGG